MVLICLANFSNEFGECWPSQATIAQETELCVRTVRDWLKKLEERGLISRLRRHRCNGSRTSDMFQLNIADINSVLSMKTETHVASKHEASPSGTKLQASAHSQPSGSLRATYRHVLPSNDKIRKYKKKSGNFSNLLNPKIQIDEPLRLEHKTKRYFAKIFISIFETDRAAAWQTWLQRNQLPNLEHSGIPIQKGESKGYYLLSRWPPSVDSEAYTNCLYLFKLKISRFFTV
ncbi:helix-turn-helix domain-containing protein [Bartonella sp. HY038]|uniref:helix-turn-helix domain-containing protein n=1 Tax=Bartonella sp. HY038 TaxID=2759660 RepID=UPI0015FAFB59|nr:helix-turn-helix domain-containing protein [Bartonella sp. HY038]